MAKEEGSTAKEGRSRDRRLSEDRNIPTIKVDIPMPKGAKPPRNSDTDSSNQSRKPSDSSR